jgi:hypothetical protein
MHIAAEPRLYIYILGMGPLKLREYRRFKSIGKVMCSIMAVAGDVALVEAFCEKSSCTGIEMVIKQGVVENHHPHRSFLAPAFSCGDSTSAADIHQPWGLRRCGVVGAAEVPDEGICSANGGDGVSGDGGSQ